MSLAALRRARASTLARQLALLRQAAGGATTCISAAAAGGSASLGLPSTASPLWRYDSPMLRHLSSIVSPLEASSAATPAADVVLPPYEQLRAAAAAAAARAGSNGRPVPQLSMTAGERTHFESLLRSFVHAAAVQDQALAIYVNRKVRLLDAWVGWGGWPLCRPPALHCWQAITTLPVSLKCEA